MTPSTAPTVKNDVTITLGKHLYTGSLRHDDAKRLLLLLTGEGPMSMSVNLEEYGRAPKSGNVFIKNWSEHAGLTERLTAAGLVRPVHQLTIGLHASVAYEVQVTL